MKHRQNSDLSCSVSLPAGMALCALTECCCWVQSYRTLGWKELSFSKELRPRASLGDRLSQWGLLVLV